MADLTAGLVVASSPGALTVVAGLPLVTRAVLALRAAGLSDVAVFAGPQTRRVRTLLADRCPEVPCLGAPEDAEGFLWPDPVLVIAGDVLFDPRGLAPLLAPAEPGAVAAAPRSDPAEIRVGIVPADRIALLLEEFAKRTGFRNEALRRVGGVSGAPIVLEAGLFVPLDGAGGGAALESALLADLARHTAAADSFIASLVDRRLSRPLTRLLLRSPVTPSQVTLASILVGLTGAAGLATVSYAGRLGGVLALIASIVLDCVDGEIARARFQQSAAGARLDVIGDYLVHLATFVGLGIGLWRQGLPPGAEWAVIALASGVVAAMITTHLLFVRPALTRGGDLHWSGDAESLRGSPVARVVEKLASRDYTYLLLVLALVGHLEWFVYAAGVGAWAFVAGLVGYWGYERRRRRASRPKGEPAGTGEGSAAPSEPPTEEAPIQLVLDLPPFEDEP